MSHTKGKIYVETAYVDGSFTIKNEHDLTVCGFSEAQTLNPKTTMENADRLVACWNACEGLPQEALDGGWTATGISQYVKRLEKENDAYRAELERLRKTDK